MTNPNSASAVSASPQSSSNIINEGHPLSKHLQINFVDSDASSRVRMSLPYNAAFASDKVDGAVHLGVLAAALDTAAGMSVVLYAKEFTPKVTLDLRMDALNPANKDCDIIIECHTYHKNDDVFYVKGLAWQETEDYPVATFYSSFISASKPLFPANNTEAPKPASAPSYPKIHFQEQKHELISKVPYAEDLGIVAGLDENEQRLFKLPFDMRHIGNPINKALQGGVSLGFLQAAGMGYVLDLHPNLKQISCANFFMEYLRSPKPVDTYARIVETKIGNRVLNLDIISFQEGRGDIAKASGRYLLPRESA